jgi:hypothetical protein
MGVPNGGPKSGSQIGVPNWGPQSGSQIGVPNWGPKLGSQIGVPNWGPKLGSKGRVNLTSHVDRLSNKIQRTLKIYFYQQGLTTDRSLIDH